MTERGREYLQQWLSPSTVMTVVLWIALAAGAWYRLGTLEDKFLALSLKVEQATNANQQAEKEAVRYQERLSTLTARIEALERFREAQNDYNTATMSTLAVLKKGI